jgi:hypothetical protein
VSLLPKSPSLIKLEIRSQTPFETFFLDIEHTVELTAYVHNNPKSKFVLIRLLSRNIRHFFVQWQLLWWLPNITNSSEQVTPIKRRMRWKNSNKWWTDRDLDESGWRLLKYTISIKPPPRWSEVQPRFEAGNFRVEVQRVAATISRPITQQIPNILKEYDLRQSTQQ